MSLEQIISFLQESLYLIVVFGAFLSYALWRGGRALINVILGLYFALLISLKFPYYDAILARAEGAQVSDSIIMVIIFAAFTIAATLLFERLIPRDDEPAFNGFGKKAIYALLATVLVMAYSYHALPITDLITPGSPIHTFFAPESHFFWWLLIPLVGLAFL